MRSQAFQIYYQAIYIYHRNLSVKHATHQKLSLFKSRSSFKVKQQDKQKLRINKNSTHFSVQNGKSCLISTLLVHTTTPTISIKNLFVHFRQIFIHIFRPYLFTKPSLQFPFSIPQQFFTSLFPHTAIPTSYTQSIVPASVIQPIQDVSRNQ